MKYPFEPGANVLYFISWLTFLAAVTSARRANEFQAFVLGPPRAGFALLPSYVSLIPYVCPLSHMYIPYRNLPDTVAYFFGGSNLRISLSKSQAHKGEDRLCFLDVKRGLALFFRQTGKDNIISQSVISYAGNEKKETTVSQITSIGTEICTEEVCELFSISFP